MKEQFCGSVIRHPVPEESGLSRFNHPEEFPRYRKQDHASPYRTALGECNPRDFPVVARLMKSEDLIPQRRIPL
jgi:hypothetical protein